MKAKHFGLLGLFGLLAGSCDDPQYVNAYTVALIITNDTTGVQRVNRCHYVPVLLGSEVKARYLVEDQLRATISLTRDDVSVLFEDSGTEVSTFVVDSDEFAEDTEIAAADAPPGFSAALRSPCTPDD